MSAGWKIPELRMPTLEEHRSASAAWLKRVGPCLYESWPQALKDLSFRTGLLELTAVDQETLRGLFDDKPDAPAANALADRITTAIKLIDPDGCFVKLSSRSPKDTFFPDVTRFNTGEEVLTAFMQSERILDDLIEYKYADTPCYLLLREYRPIPKHEEWRCFIRKGKIAGITQYHYRDYFPELVADCQGIEAQCLVFLERFVLPKLHLDTVVVDVWTGKRPILIEINPYGLSDPCLLSYPELETSTGLFRIVEVDPA